jgi:hypothetical protein
MPTRHLVRQEQKAGKHGGKKQMTLNIVRGAAAQKAAAASTAAASATGNAMAGAAPAQNAALGAAAGGVGAQQGLVEDAELPRALEPPPGGSTLHSALPPEALSRLLQVRHATSCRLTALACIVCAASAVCVFEIELSLYRTCLPRPML